MFVPRHVLAALPGLPKFVRQRPMPGSWGSHDVSRVTTDAGTVVVKQWSGPHRMARGLAEAQVLGRLERAAFSRAARPVALAGAPALVDRDGGSAWTAQSYLRGTAVTVRNTADRAFADALGALLASFHRRSTPQSSPVAVASRLPEIRLLPELVGGVPPEDAALAVRAFRLAAAHLDELLTLPTCQLHGDLNFENLIDSAVGPKLIDLEFTRVDVRMLDLAALAAPVRDPDGTLRIIGGRFIRGVLAAYCRELAGDELAPDPTELELLPVLSLTHFLLVLTDQLRAGSPHVGLVLPVVARLVERAARFDSAGRGRAAERPESARTPGRRHGRLVR